MKRLLLPGLLLLAGCAAAPSVRIAPLAGSPHRDDLIPFRLADSVIVIGAAITKDDIPASGIAPPISFAPATVHCDARGCSGPALASLVVPVDDMRGVFTLQPGSRHLVSTSLTATYVPNMLRLQKLAVAVKDRRVEAINAIGGIALGVRNLVAPKKSEDQALAGPGVEAAAVLTLPLVIELADATATPAAIADVVPGCRAGGEAICHALPGNPGWVYALHFRDDAAAQGFLPRPAIGTVRGALVTSVCRRAQLAVDHVGGEADQPKLTFNVMVADPMWLMTIPLPAKGELQLHTLCGADTSREPATEAGWDDMVKAVNANVEALRTPAGH